MKNFDFIVVGSGITGLTAARILSQHGKSVLLLEKAPILGGSLARFRLRGVPFDVGFHFTGGFNDEGTGVLDVMLSLLGVRHRFKPLYFPRDASHRMIFPSLGADYVVPSGIGTVCEKLKRDFPAQRAGLDKYFKRFNAVVEGTPTLTVSGFDELPPPLEEDHVSLQAVMDECVSDKMLQTILGGLCMCYGTKPQEVSFSTHCRVSFGLQESLARVEDGGDAFVDALADALKQDNVEIRTKTWMRECLDIRDRKAMRFALSDGTEVGAGGVILTIHPKAILGILPREHVSKAFTSRVNDFEASNGFFTLYGTLNQEGNQPGAVSALEDSGPATLTSILPNVDLNRMLTWRAGETEEGPMMVLRSRERTTGGTEVDTVTALEVAFGESTAHWADTKLKRRPAEYYAYKQRRTDSVVQRMLAHIPQCRGMKVVDSATTLTYRDYLYNPDGSAYGVRQKMGQLNVSGKLPINNMYAAGQSALLPGVLGGMTSAFFVCRGLLGRDVFRHYLSGKACLSSAL